MWYHSLYRDAGPVLCNLTNMAKYRRTSIALYL